MKDTERLVPNSPYRALNGTVLLSWAGMLLCALLSFSETAFCEQWGNCGAILASRFSKIGIVPLAWVGEGFYMTVLALAMGLRANNDPTVRKTLIRTIQGLTVGGALISAALMSIQFGVLRAFCPLCTLSAGLAISLCLLSTCSFPNRASKATFSESAGFFVMICVSVAVLIFSKAQDLKRPMGPLTSSNPAFTRLDGPAEAPVRLVVFSDFQCGFCSTLAATLKRVRETFPREVQLGFRYFPGGKHPRAWISAEAAECAFDQGKFWQFHDELFAHGGALEDSDLLRVAKAAGLEVGLFQKCLGSASGHATVEASYRDGLAQGIRGTPSLFLNGRMIGGAVEYERLATLIRAEIRATTARESPKPPPR